jgi:UTP--glucose-1-phosphate uridylyltransferase
MFGPIMTTSRKLSSSLLPSPAVSEGLESDLERLPNDVRELLSRYGFDNARLLRWSRLLARGGEVDNRVKGRVEAPALGDVADLPPEGSTDRAALTAAGQAALARGECALVVLAGGMATRMGGVVKALVEAIPGNTFLDLRIREVERLGRAAGRPVPLWLMTSSATDEKIRDALGPRLDGEDLAVFPQHLSLRLTPEGRIFLDDDGTASEYATGHGDLPDALRGSGLLARFRSRGGKVVMVANLDNLGATVDPTILGWHLSHGKPVTCEVVDKVAGDRGGIPVRLDGRPIVLEEFRLPPDFDPKTVRVFNTNTFHFDARALDELDMEWTFFQVKKEVAQRPVIQFERLIGEVTSVLDTRFLRLPRDAAASRFLPVKDPEELVARRPTIEIVMRARGIIS